MSDELKPCPFCGGVKCGIEGFVGATAVECYSCGAKGPESENPSRAAIAWNRRASPAEPAALPPLDAEKWTVQQEAQIRYETEKLRAAEAFEWNVKRLQSLIEQGHKFDWPYTDAFDDGGRAYHEAKRRIASKTAPSRPEPAGGKERA